MNSVPLEAGNTAPIEFKQITNEAFAVMTVSEHGLIYDCSQKEQISLVGYNTI